MTECLFNTAVPVTVRALSGGASTTLAGAAGTSYHPLGMPFYSTATPVSFQDPSGRQVNTVVFEIYLVPLVAGKKMLQLRVSDANDPFFMFQLDLGEEDYHQLRREQNLFVDFANFPYRLIELLQRCLQEGSTRQFAAQLATGQEESGRGIAVLSFQEATSFRQVTQLSLRLKAVGEDVIRRQLSDLLNRYREQISALQCNATGPVPVQVPLQTNVHVPSNIPFNANAPSNVPFTTPPSNTPSNTAKVHMTGMQSLLREKDEACAHMNELLEMTRDSKRQLEETNGELKRKCEQQEGEIIRCTDEINKANDIIRKLQEEIRTLKARVKTAASIADDQAANAAQLKASNERQAAELERMGTELAELVALRKRLERDAVAHLEDAAVLRRQNAAKDDIIAHFQQEQNVLDLNRALRQLDQSASAVGGSLGLSGIADHTDTNDNDSNNNNTHRQPVGPGYVGSRIFEASF